MRTYLKYDKEFNKKFKRETVDTINKGDSIAFAQEKMMEEQKNNLTDEEKTKIEGFVNEMKQAVKDKDVNKINELEASINNAWNEISQRIYAKQAQSNAQQTTEEKTSENDAETVQDADFEEVK